jgi:hypothetical protein
MIFPPLPGTFNQDFGRVEGCLYAAKPVTIQYRKQKNVGHSYAK